MVRIQFHKYNKISIMMMSYDLGSLKIHTTIKISLTLKGLQKNKIKIKRDFIREREIKRDKIFESLTLQ